MKINIKQLRSKVTLAGGFLLNTKDCTRIVQAVNGRYIALLLSNLRVAVWDLIEQKQLLFYENAKYKKEGVLINPIALTTDGSRLAVAISKVFDDLSVESKVLVIEVATGEIIRELVIAGFWIENHMLFDHTGTLLTISMAEGPSFNARSNGFFVWEWQSGELITRYDTDKKHGGKSMTQALSVNAVLASFGNYYHDSLKEVLLYWTPDQVRLLSTDLKLCSVALSPDGEQIFLAGENEKMQSVFQLLDKNGTILKEKNVEDFPTLGAYPHWHYEGKLITLNGDTQDICIIDAQTLDLVDKVQWEDGILRFCAPNWAILAGIYNVALPADQLHVID